MEYFAEAMTEVRNLQPAGGFCFVVAVAVVVVVVVVVVM
jgi:hypothetical protein